MFCVGDRESETQSSVLETHIIRSPTQKARQVPRMGRRQGAPSHKEDLMGKLAMLGLDQEILPGKGGRLLCHGHPPGGGTYG